MARRSAAGPLAMAVGNAVLDVVAGDGFLEQVRRVAGTMQQGMEGLKGRYPELVKEVTGAGLLRGLRMKDPLPLRGKLSDRGLLVGTAGNNTLRLAPPLVVTENDVRRRWTLSTSSSRHDDGCRVAGVRTMDHFP